MNATPERRRARARMLTIAAAACAPMLLGGCLLPMPVTIAMWSASGISYLTTQKSLTDHGISAIAGQDCALHRIITDGEVCSEEVAENDEDVRPSLFAFDNGPKQELEDAMELASAPEAQPVAAVSAEPLPDLTVAAVSAESLPAPAAVEIAEAPAPMAAAPENDAAKPGYYYVIGSFKTMDRAGRLLESSASLDSRVIQAKVGETTYHRVVVGPFPSEGSANAKNAVTSAGYKDAWKVRL